MLLERTIFQLDIGPVPADRAATMGQLGYLQWLDGLPGHSCYRTQARHAVKRARPFADVSPAIAVFCRLIEASLAMPPHPLDLALPARCRRGGAQARRLSL